MDVANLIFSAIAGVGALIAGARWWRNRPWHSIEMQLGIVLTIPMAAFGGGRRLVRMRAFGTSVLTDVDVHGIGCEICPGSEGPPFGTLAPGQVGQFSVNVADDEADEAWVIVNWTTPGSRHGRLHTIWLPLNHNGPLAEVRKRQLARSGLLSATLRLAGMNTPSPVTIAAGHVQASPRDIARRELDEKRGRGRSRARRPRWWKLALLKILRLPPVDAPWAAMSDPRDDADE